jgi:nucleoside phosphorylase
MEKRSWSFDVCIVCALYEEAEAVLNEFSTRCSVSFLKEFSGMDRYEYRYTSILNNRGESLTVLVTWLSESGPTQTGLDLKPFLHEFRPRFVAMTGFCAGYKEKVKWGDLVVAQYAYFYEAGKIISEPDGLSRHLQEMKAAASTSQVLHYTRGFDGWKEPVKKMKSDRLKRLLKETEEPRCVIAPMASGMAVRQDDPFLWLRGHYDRNTVGLDMEAATFYHVFRAVPHIHALVVKGVCDHADMNKNDAYHDYAARVSAVYLLTFIQEYVTEQTMPRPDVPSPSDQAGPCEVWNVPNKRPDSPRIAAPQQPKPSSRRSLKFLFPFLLLVFIVVATGGGFWVWVAHNQASLPNTPEGTGAIWCDAFLTHNPNEAASVATARLKTHIQNGDIPFRVNYNICMVTAVLERTGSAAIVILDLDNKAYERQINMVYQQGKWLGDQFFTSKQ